MARATPGADTAPRDSIEYLAVRAECPDGRLRMINVAHRWRDGAYVFAEDACGRVPAIADSYKGWRKVPGFYAGGYFYLRQED